MQAGQLSHYLTHRYSGTSSQSQVHVLPDGAADVRLTFWIVDVVGDGRRAVPAICIEGEGPAEYQIGALFRTVLLCLCAQLQIGDRDRLFER